VRQPGFDAQLTRGAEKDRRSLRRACARELDAALLSLEADRSVGEALSGDLKGVRSLHWRANRVEYRAAYVVLVREAIAAGRLPSDPEADEEDEERPDSST